MWKLYCGFIKKEKYNFLWFFGDVMFVFKYDFFNLILDFYFVLFYFCWIWIKVCFILIGVVIYVKIWC